MWVECGRLRGHLRRKRKGRAVTWAPGLRLFVTYVKSCHAWQRRILCTPSPQAHFDSDNSPVQPASQISAPEKRLTSCMRVAAEVKVVDLVGLPDRRSDS
jgi:hypothetical protein